MTDTLYVDGERAWWGLFETEADHGPEQWAYRFEQVLPFPVEDLACAYTRLADGRILAVGVSGAAVESRLSDPQSLTSWTLSPDRIPQFLLARGVAQASATTLNLFSGGYISQPLRRQRRRLIGCWLAGCAMTGILLLGGGQLKIAAIDRTRASVDDDRRQIAERAAPASVGGQQLPPEARLQQALRQSQGRGGETQIITDQMILLDHLWAVWPAQPPVHLRDVSANAHQISVKISLASNSDLSALMTPLTTIPGMSGEEPWRLNPPDLPAFSGGEATIVLTWKPPPTGRTR
jgi:hypothetical protein